MYKNRVQLLNPKTKHWVKVDTDKARIIGHKWDDKPYKNVEIHSELQLKILPKIQHIENGGNK